MSLLIEHVFKSVAHNHISTPVYRQQQILLTTVAGSCPEKGFEVDENGDQYVFPRLTLSTIRDNTPTTQVAWTHRLKKVFYGADKDGAIILNGRIPTLYMFRHGYITNRLLRGVSMEDISINCGTSITYIESTYSHLTTAMRSKEITKDLGMHRVKSTVQV